MMKSKKYWIVLFAVFVLAACTYDFPEIEQVTEQDLGAVNTVKIVAVGDGFLAGAMDGALYTDGQNNSIASIIVSQMNKISETDFVQADINTENGFNFYVSDENSIYGKWIYKFSGMYEEEPELVFTNGEGITDFSGDKSILNDLTVPQLRVTNVFDNSLSENIYFSRISTDENRNLAEQIISKSPSFVVCWFGMNDYLDYARLGASNEELFSSEEQFQTDFEKFITELIQNTNSNIVVGNLLSIKDLPFFYMNQYNFIRLSNAKMGSAQASYYGYNMAVAAFNVGKPMQDWRPMISFEDNGATLSPQSVVVIDDSLPSAFYSNGTALENYRQLSENEMALFSITPEMIKNGYGSTIPISKEYFLTENEIEDINARTVAFNQIILNVAQKYSDRVVIADISSEIKKITETGRIDSWGIPESEELVYFNGVPIKARLEQNSIYSLDAIHFNQRGNAFVANAFIKAINSGFNANISQVDLNNFKGNIATFDF